MTRTGAPDRPRFTQYERVNSNGLNVGDVVIVEMKHFDKTGRPQDSEYFRTVVGEHMTVSGMMKHLTSEPDFTFPNIPPWPMGWIYAGNYMTVQMWREKP